MPLEEGIECMKKGFAEINTRFLMGGSTFTLKVSSFVPMPQKTGPMQLVFRCDFVARCFFKKSARENKPP